MKRPLAGFSKGSIGFTEAGFLDLGLLASAGEKRTWNYDIVSCVEGFEVCGVLEGLHIAEL